MKDVVTIFTDGSADNRILDCGAAVAVIRYGKYYREIVSGSWSSTTNNRMEALGIIIGLKAVKKGFKINLTTDSEVCLKWIAHLQNDYPTDSDIRQNKNADILFKLQKVLKKHEGNIAFNWVKGHIGVEDNERCDTLAGEAALWENPTRDIGSGISECPQMIWMLDKTANEVRIENAWYLDEAEYVNSRYEEEYLGVSRKMSNKEVTQLLKDKGWRPKDIKELKIDKSAYQKPF
jgi:ribonuclease HI